MKKWILFSVLLFTISQITIAQNINQYQFWFDGSGTVTTQVVSPAKPSFNLLNTIPTGSLSPGLHYLHIRFRDDDGNYSSVLTHDFVKLASSPGGLAQITAYKYWFDNNYASAVVNTITAGQDIILNTGLPVNTLTNGLHSLHISFQDGGGNWSSVKSQFFYKGGSGSGPNLVTGYRYWFNQNPNIITENNFSAPVAETNVTFTVDASYLTNGTATLHMQFKDTYGNWSSTFTSSFYKTGVSGVPNMTLSPNMAFQGQIIATAINGQGNVFSGTSSNSSISLLQGNYTINFDAGTFSKTNNNHVSVQWHIPSNAPLGIYELNVDGVVLPYAFLVYNVANPPKTFIIGDGGNHKVVADPVDVALGSYGYNHKDFDIPAQGGHLNFTHSYNTANSAVNGVLGYGWTNNYNYTLTNIGDSIWSVNYGDGHTAVFIPTPFGNGTSHPLYKRTYETLTKNLNDSTFTLVFKNGDKYKFSKAGILIQIADRNANITALTYTGGNLTSVTVAGSSRALNFTYDGSGRITTVTDPLGRQIHFSYDANGNLATSTDANGGQTNFSYNNLHLVTQVTDPLGNSLVKNTYDTQNRVITQLDANSKATGFAYDTPNPGYTTITYPNLNTKVFHHDSSANLILEQNELSATKTYTYDSNNNVSSIQDENGNTFLSTYDNMGNRLTETQPVSGTSSNTYNSFNLPTTINDALGNSTNLVYDTSGNLTAKTNPDGGVLTFVRNVDGTLNSSTDAMGNTITYTYNNNRDVISITAPNGTKNFTYDASGRKVTETDENGHTTSYTYDNNDNVTEVKDALNQTAQSTYTLNNSLLTQKDKRGLTTKYTYDAKNRKTAIKDANGGTTQFVYDDNDNLISKTDANGNTTTFIYDAANHLISKTDPIGTTAYTYDAVGNKLSQKNPLGQTSYFTYDAQNRLLSSTDALGNKTEKAYNADDLLTSVKDANGAQTIYLYNPLKLLINITDANGGITAITYDKNGNKTSVTDANTHIQNYQYDGANRLTQYTDASGNITKLAYDNAGNLTSTTKPTGTITKAYDEVNCLKSVSLTSGDSYSFSYDGDNNILTMSNNTGSSSFQYDSLNLVSNYTDPFGNSVSFKYDNLGNKTKIIYPTNKAVNYVYNAESNLTSVKDWLNQTFNYSYDAAGRVLKLIYPNSIQNNYVYDNAGRLIEKNTITSVNDTISVSHFQLDNNGNRVKEYRKGPLPLDLTPSSFAYSYTNDDKLIKDGITNYTNDNNGNRTNQTKGSKAISYVFSTDNLLSSLTDSSGSLTYKYNPMGDRLQKTSGGSTVNYLLDLTSSLSQVLQETGMGNSIKASYVYGLGLLERIDGNGTVNYYHFDAQHNTVALSDITGANTDTYTYDPFGVILTHTGSTNQPYTFLGEYGVQQEKPSLYFARARYFDAGNGRFLSKDPLEGNTSNPQSLNKYVYSLNNPFIYSDPSGLIAWGSLGIAGLQALSLFGDAAQVGLAGIAAATAGPLLGTSTILSGTESLNNATKDFQAYYANFEKAINNDNNWVTANNFNGSLDFALKNPTVSKVLTINDVASGLFNLSGDIGNIETASNYFGTLDDYASEAVNGSTLNSIFDLLGVYSSFSDGTSYFEDLFDNQNKAVENLKVSK